MYVRAGRPAFARPCVGVHKSTSLMSSFLLLQQCPAFVQILNKIITNIESKLWITKTHVCRTTGTKFTITERKNALDNITVIMETHKDKGIKQPQTLTPNGFNIKLDHLQNTRLK